MRTSKVSVAANYSHLKMIAALVQTLLHQLVLPKSSSQPHQPRTVCKAKAKAVVPQVAVGAVPASHHAPMGSLSPGPGWSQHGKESPAAEKTW